MKDSKPHSRAITLARAVSGYGEAVAPLDDARITALDELVSYALDLQEQLEAARRGNIFLKDALAESQEQLETTERAAMEWKRRNYKKEDEITEEWMPLKEQLEAVTKQRDAIMAMLEAERPPEEVFAYARSLSNPAKESVKWGPDHPAYDEMGQ